MYDYDNITTRTTSDTIQPSINFFLAFSFLCISDVAYVAEAILLDMRFIERDPHTNNVRLTPFGR